jgi:D-alanyl-D-alanine carboxypeptidase
MIKFFIKQKKTFLFFILLVFYFPSHSQEIKIARLRHALQLKLDELTAADKIPGVTFAVVFPDEKTLCLSSGFSDIENKIKMKPGDRMLSASIGKTYLVPIILQLEEENRLSIEDHLKKYFSGEDWFKSLPNGNDITLKMLLNHTSGIPEYVEKKALWIDSKQAPDKIWKAVERLQYILGDKPINPAGKGWSYADTNYIILGMIIEKITGNTYYHELDKRVLKVLKLFNTTPSDRRKLEGLVPGYSRLGEPFNYNGKVLQADGRYIYNPQLEWTGGGLITNSLDLAIWAKRLYEGKICSQKALTKMLIGVKTNEGLDYGLGVIIWDSDYGTSYGHTGFIHGYNSIMEYVPAYKFSVALQFNCDYVSKVTKKDRHEIAADFIRSVIRFLDSAAI